LKNCKGLIKKIFGLLFGVPFSFKAVGAFDLCWLWVFVFRLYQFVEGFSNPLRSENALSVGTSSSLMRIRILLVGVWAR